MKVKVLQTFRDRHTLELHRKGEVFECTKARFDEILGVGKFVEEVKEKKTKKKSEEK